MDKVTRIGLRGWRHANARTRRTKRWRDQVGTIGWLAIVAAPILVVLGVYPPLIGGVAILAMVCLTAAALLDGQVRRQG